MLPHVPPENEQLMNEVLRRVEQSPSICQIVLGDFQRPPGTIHQMRTLATLSWVLSSAWPSVSERPTNYPPMIEPWQLDGIVVSPALTSRTL